MVGLNTVNILKIWTPKKSAVNILKLEQYRFTTNGSKRCRWNGKQCRPWSDCSRRSLIWVYIVCPDPSVQKHRIIMVLSNEKKVCHWFWLFGALNKKRCSYEPRHDKTNIMAVRPAKTQISLGVCPVWSESSLSAWRKLGSLSAQQTLIRLGGCRGWSESSLGTQSFCWFCHEAAHIYLQ